MKPRSTLRIAGHDYTVELVPADHPDLGEGNEGRCQPSEETLLILDTLKPSQQRKTMLHELIHCLDHHYNPDEAQHLTEAQVVAMENGLWRHHGSPSKVAKVLDIAVRNVCARRVRMENKYNIQLDTIDIRAGKRPSVETHAPVHKLRIQNGTIIVASDLHFWPGIRTTAYNALLHFIAIKRPQIVVMNGDVMDGAAISRHPRIGWERVPSVIQELDACTEYLNEIEEIAGKADLVWTLGNHCARFASRLAAVATEYANVKGFQLKDHFPNWTPCWRLDINDDVVIKHRLKGGIHATHNNTVTAGKTMVTGHLHALKVTPYSDYNGTRYGVDTGTVAEPDGAQFINYTEAAPMNWRSGFAILTFKEGRLLMPQLVQKWDDDHVEFGGEVIKVSQWGKAKKKAKPRLVA